MTAPKNPYKKPDRFTKAAKSEGFPARSVYKLEEIDRRARLLKPGQRVIDLGAAPGSWSMYVARTIGRAGRLLAVDLSPITVGIGANATVIQGDAFELPTELLIEHGPFDVVLSDMAPATTGQRDSDRYRSYELVMRALEVARRHGKQGSSFVAKIFMGPEYEDARRALREVFADVRTLRPETVRKNSVEVFFVATGKRSGPEAEAPVPSPPPAPTPAPAPPPEPAPAPPPEPAPAPPPTLETEPEAALPPKGAKRRAATPKTATPAAAKPTAPKRTQAKPKPAKPVVSRARAPRGSREDDR